MFWATVEHRLLVLGCESREAPGNALGGDAPGTRLANEPEIHGDPHAVMAPRTSRAADRSSSLVTEGKTIGFTYAY
jgi:hypothetical protein